MNINDAFAATYLKAQDLMGQDVKLTIDRVEVQEVGDDTKPVLYFRGKDKALVLNKTNASTIADQHGAETDHWPGKEITLFPSQTDFQGKQVPCIRVRLAANAATGSFAPVDDDVPF